MIVEEKDKNIHKNKLKEAVEIYNSLFLIYGIKCIFSYVQLT